MNILILWHVKMQCKPNCNSIFPIPCAQICYQCTHAISLRKKFFCRIIISSSMFWLDKFVISLSFSSPALNCCSSGTGSTELSPYSMTLLSGFLAVISVNIIIAFYICMAMKEPSDKHEPDPKFVADAKASITQSNPNEAESSSNHTKRE